MELETLPEIQIYSYLLFPTIGVEAPKPEAKPATFVENGRPQQTMSGLHCQLTYFSCLELSTVMILL